MPSKKQAKAKSKDKLRQFLLTFFDNGDHYAEKFVNGFWLVKCRYPQGWHVMVYTGESFKNYKEFGQMRIALREAEAIGHLTSLNEGVG